MILAGSDWRAAVMSGSKADVGLRVLLSNWESGPPKTLPMSADRKMEVIESDVPLGRAASMRSGLCISP
jgi:hypothetical protein